MEPKFIIKIRWNCGTERYVTGYTGRDSVGWESEKPAYDFGSYETAREIVLGLNLNHISPDLGGFACVVAVDDPSKYVNPSLEDEEDGERWRLIKLQEQVRSQKEVEDEVRSE